MVRKLSDRNICMVSGIEGFGNDEILSITAYLVTIFFYASDLYEVVSRAIAIG
jgi:hypothetical protein